MTQPGNDDLTATLIVLFKGREQIEIVQALKHAMHPKDFIAFAVAMSAELQRIANESVQSATNAQQVASADKAAAISRFMIADAVCMVASQIEKEPHARGERHYGAAFDDVLMDRLEVFKNPSKGIPDK